VRALGENGHHEMEQLALGDYEDVPLEEPPPEPGEVVAGLGTAALPPSPDSRSVAEARLQLADRIAEGSICPCCGHRVQAYRWSLYATAVRLLAAMYRAGGTAEFVRTKDIKGKGQGDASRLRYWGLAEEEPERREDGGRSGYWRVTGLGEQYLRGEAALPRYAWVYAGRVLLFEGERRRLGETEAGKEFDFRAMMEGAF
jgi:hypothetical protein